MTAQQIERFRRIEALFDAALEHTAGPERDTFLDREADRDLVAEVRQLLADDERVTASVPPPPELLPTFGAWQAIKLLGRGGMGVVYLAERADGAFKMRAAVKVVPLALASAEIEERFRRERQFLAGLEHPKIARLIDGGLTAAGLPYLVMEYVDGLAIDRYCDQHQFDTRSRIALMRQVLDALIYVHSRQVMHRDLKSSNILVDSSGNIKLLDFGTARLADASGEHAITRSGVFAFTPETASPEQVQGKPLTFASDVYSAGVLLYRLLTGRPPYQLPAGAAAAAAVIGSADAAPSGLARPLDAILRKALRKRPEERYASFGEMDADLACYLLGQPVQARAPGKLQAAASRLLSKPSFLWLAVVAFLCVVLALEGISALQQYRRNQLRLVQVRNLSQSYLTDILNEVGKLPGSLSARMLIVDRARRNLDELLADAPADPELRRILATAYLKLGDIQGRPFTVSVGDPAGAVVSYRKAESLAAQGRPRDWELLAVLIRSRINIATIQARAGQFSGTMALIESTLEPARRLWKEGPPGLQFDGNPAPTLAIDANLRLGFVMHATANPAPTVELYRRVIDQYRRTVAIAEEIQLVYSTPRDLAAVPSQYLGFALGDLAGLTGDMHDYQAAVAAHRRAVRGICQLEVSQPSPQTVRNCADGWSELSWALRNAGDGEAAIQAAREALSRMEPLARAEPESAEAREDLVAAYLHLGAAEEVAGKLPEAIADLRAAERCVRSRQNPSDPLLGSIHAYVGIQRLLARVLRENHDLGGAMKALQNGLAAANGHPTIDASAREDLMRQMEELRAGRQHRPPTASH